MLYAEHLYAPKVEKILLYYICLLGVYLFVYLICLLFCLPLVWFTFGLFTCVFAFWFVYLFVCLWFVYLLVCLWLVYLVCLLVCLLVCWPLVCLLACLPLVSLLVYWFVYLFTGLFTCLPGLFTCFGVTERGGESSCCHSPRQPEAPHAREPRPEGRADGLVP